MPGYVIGRNELITSAKKMIAGSNATVLTIVLGARALTEKAPMMVSDLQDVARIEIQSLDLEKVKVASGDARSFLIDGGSAIKGTKFNDARNIARKLFPKAVQEGKLKLRGGIESVGLLIESSNTVDAFGEMGNYEEMVREVVGQYLELLDKEQVRS